MDESLWAKGDMAANFMVCLKSVIFVSFLTLRVFFHIS